MDVSRAGGVPSGPAYHARRPALTKHRGLLAHATLFVGSVSDYNTSMAAESDLTTLRHTFGTQAAASGVPLRTLQEWMAHRDYKTTLIYADYAPRSAEGQMIERAFAAGASTRIDPHVAVTASVLRATSSDMRQRSSTVDLLHLKPMARVAEQRRFAATPTTRQRQPFARLPTRTSTP
jgi:hypothetical protein